MRKLEYALKTKDFTAIQIIDAKNVKNWDGDYQIEVSKEINNKKKLKM